MKYFLNLDNSESQFNLIMISQVKKAQFRVITVIAAALVLPDNNSVCPGLIVRSQLPSDIQDPDNFVLYLGIILCGI